jgi:hypothetical protein
MLIYDSSLARFLARSPYYNILWESSGSHGCQLEQLVNMQLIALVGRV